jgi:DNA-binding Lrp family transcriptional regulator
MDTMSECRQTTSAIENSAVTTPTPTINVSRQSLELELAKMGVNADFFKVLTIDQLSDLLSGLNKVARSQSNGSNQARRSGRAKIKAGLVVLSSTDKIILRALLESKGNPSSIQLSRDLDIPLSTVQRRRKRLEEECVSESYSLQYEKFGRKHVTLIISVGTGDSAKIANEILELEKVTLVSRTMGDNADLKAEAVVETNEELAHICQTIKAMPGVQKLSWFETLELLAEKRELDITLVESM